MLVSWVSCEKKIVNKLLQTLLTSRLSLGWLGWSNG